MAQEASPWRKGPPKWVYSAIVLAASLIGYALAGLDVNRFFDVWRETWEFFTWAFAATTTGAVALHMQKRKIDAKKHEEDDDVKGD